MGRFRHAHDVFADLQYKPSYPSTPSQTPHDAHALVATKRLREGPEGPTARHAIGATDAVPKNKRNAQRTSRAHRACTATIPKHSNIAALAQKRTDCCGARANAAKSAATSENAHDVLASSNNLNSPKRRPTVPANAIKNAASHGTAVAHAHAVLAKV